MKQPLFPAPEEIWGKLFQQGWNTFGGELGVQIDCWIDLDEEVPGSATLAKRNFATQRQRATLVELIKLTP